MFCDLTLTDSFWANFCEPAIKKTSMLQGCRVPYLAKNWLANSEKYNHTSMIWIDLSEPTRLRTKFLFKMSRPNVKYIVISLPSGQTAAYFSLHVLEPPAKWLIMPFKGSYNNIANKAFVGCLEPVGSVKCVVMDLFTRCDDGLWIVLSGKK